MTRDLCCCSHCLRIMVRYGAVSGLREDLNDPQRRLYVLLSVP